MFVEQVHAPDEPHHHGQGHQALPKAARRVLGHAAREPGEEAPLGRGLGLGLGLHRGLGLGLGHLLGLGLLGLEHLFFGPEPRLLRPALGLDLRLAGQERGLSDRSLGRLRIGWSAEPGAWSFPMHDEQERVRGIRLRTPGGRKFAVSGGREGLFYPHGLTFLDRLLICEGPTDTAAALDLGFEAVGRPSCTGGTRLLRNLVSGKRPSEVVVVADGDGPGLRGAESLAATLVLCCPAVRIIQPPEGIKDLRAWLQAGATHDKVLAVIEAAPLRKLKLNREAR